MPQTCNYNCAELPDHEQVSRCDYLYGGFNAGAIVECDHTITDWSNPSEWTANINAGKAKIFGPVRGSIPEPSPVEGENPNSCGNDTILDGFDRTAIWKDYNVSPANTVFYNALNRRTAYVVLVNCKNGDMIVIDVPANFVALDSAPESKKEKRMYNVTAKWSSMDIPESFEAPAGIFDFPTT